MIKVMIADDHKMFADCVEMALDKKQFEVAAIATDGLEALKLALEHRPQVVVLDVNMPSLHGLDLAREIHRVAPLTRIVFLTCRTDEACIREALRLGAKGYILKSEPLEQVAIALQTVSEGGTYISLEFIGPLLVQWLQKSDVETDPVALSLRERQVLKLIAEGHSTKQIASMLNISPKTADTHRARLMAKLGAHEIASLVRYAIREGIVAA
ncbi:MAG: response regulator transcription factor [Acidobacteria bacterium]|nr:response regulator transcription factor [Acidobacteriota bacterium]